MLGLTGPYSPEASLSGARVRQVQGRLKVLAAVENSDDGNSLVIHIKSNHSPSLVVRDSQAWADVITACAPDRESLQTLSVIDNCVGVPLGNRGGRRFCDVAVQRFKLALCLRREDNWINRERHQALVVADLWTAASRLRTWAMGTALEGSALSASCAGPTWF